MASLPIRRIDARTFCHATEEEERVANALTFACPECETCREVLEGYFGNPLVRLTCRVEDKRAIQVVWERWAAAGVPAAIADEVDARLDPDGFLHFRFDKQEAYAESLQVASDSDAIDVRVKLIAYPANPEETRRVARSILPGAR